MRHGDPMPHEGDLPPLVPMSSAVMADAQAQIAEAQPSLLARVFMAQADEAGRHPEDFCHRCEGPNISWFTPGAVWDPVMRPNPGEPWKWQEIICPLCFVELAANGGKQGSWTLLPAKDDGERYTSADERAAIRAQVLAEIAGMDRDYCVDERDVDDFDPTTKDPDAMRAASYWRKLVEVRATIERQQARIDAQKAGADGLRKALREAEERITNILTGRDIEQTMIHYAVARLARVEALITTWHASPDMRTRAHADRLSEAFDGRPRE